MALLNELVTIMVCTHHRLTGTNGQLFIYLKTINTLIMIIKLLKVKQVIKKKELLKFWFLDLKISVMVDSLGYIFLLSFCFFCDD